MFGSSKTSTTITAFVFTLIITVTSADYWSDRDALIKNEESRMLGASIVLTDKENAVNAILMGYKLKEYDAGFENPGIFAPGRHFFESRKDIEKSKVFEFIKRVPKGAALHGHDTALVSEQFVYDLTHRDNLYACTVEGRLRLRFMANSGIDNSCDWELISVLRRDIPTYDEWVRTQLTLKVKRPKDAYPDINKVWRAFTDLFMTVDPLVTYKPIFQEHIYQALQELHEDNVMYAEIRGTLPTVYELDGSTYTPLEIAGFYQEVFEQFKADHPDFLGARLIFGPVRKVDNATIDEYIQIAKSLQQNYPDLLAGFDLVGQEDLGWPLTDFVAKLEEIKDLNFFFHAGETNWYGSKTDFNIIDAILLGSKRIGHGYAVTKHPLAMKFIKERQIAIEVCPISNQVLMLVDDMRNHPAAALIADGYPVVISYDDPSFWSTKGLSYDFYMAFMGIASRNADLKLLKQLARNSIEYSAMAEPEKSAALTAWETKWNEFIDEMIASQYKKNAANRIRDDRNRVSVTHIK